MTFALFGHQKNRSRMAINPTAPGCVTEGAVDSEGIARTATSDITDERGFSNLIQGLGASRLGSGSNMLGRELMS